MIKAKKIGLILDKDIQIDAVLRNGMIIGVTCEFIDADYDRLYLRFPDEKLQLDQYFYEGREIEIGIDTLEGRRTYLGTIIYEPEDGLMVIEYKETSDIQQNRKLLRVRATRGILISLQPEQHITMLTIDISGGGCRLLSQEELKAGVTAEASLRLIPNEPPINATVRVLASRYFPIENKYELSVEFIEIKEVDRKRIMRFCYETQSSVVDGKNRVI